MAYDEKTTGRLRAALADARIEEKRMMGGVCFMLAGNMLGGAHREKSGERYFMFRLADPEYRDALEQPHVRPVQMGTRAPMRGLVFVDADACSDAELQRWVALARAHVERMPAK